MEGGIKRDNIIKTYEHNYRITTSTAKIKPEQRSTTKSTTTITTSPSQPNTEKIPEERRSDIQDTAREAVKITSTKPKHEHTIISDRAEDADSDNDILNKNVSDTCKIKAMERAAEILSESKTHLHLQTNPKSKDLWLMTTIKTIINTSDKIISPHKYKFENKRDAAKINTKILKKNMYNLTKALHRERGLHDGVGVRI